MASKSSDEYLYTTKFESVVTATNQYEKDLHISKANLDELASIMPADIDLDKNIDLLGVAFNAAVVNSFNKNGDGISCPIAKEIFPYFKNKPTNIEHISDNVIGHIVNARLTSIEDNQILEPEELEGFIDPFYITLASVVYKTVNPEFAKFLLQTSDEDSEYYKAISASWEIGFNNFNIAITNGSDRLSDATIVTDAGEINRLSPYLRAFGGSGVTPEGLSLFRLIEGPVYPLGVAFTTNPAANVSGVFTMENNTLVIKDKKHFLESDSNSQELEESIDKVDIKNSQINNSDVKKDNNILNMDITQLTAEIEKVIDSKSDSDISEKSVASISSVISDALVKQSAEFTAERERIEADKSQVEEEAKEAKASMEGLKEQLSTAETKITELTTSIEAAQAAELFNTRMSRVNDIYSLDDSYRAVLTNEIKSLDLSEAAFDAYLGKLEVTLKHKSKAFLEDQEKAQKEKIDELVEAKLAELQTSTASTTEDDVSTAVENATATEEGVVTNNNGDSSSVPESITERIVKNFKKENIKIEY